MISPIPMIFDAVKTSLKMLFDTTALYAVSGNWLRIQVMDVKSRIIFFLSGLIAQVSCL